VLLKEKKANKIAVYFPIDHSYVVAVRMQNEITN